MGVGGSNISISHGQGFLFNVHMNFCINMIHFDILTVFTLNVKH